MCKITKENDSLQRQTENKDEDSQKIQGNKNIPELRFPEFEGEWITYKLCDVVTRIIRKNKNLETKRPLTISAKYGLIDQIEFFDKYVASKNLKGYYLLKKGEFAYNKSYSNGFPYGAVKRLDLYNQGAISTLYICFEITNKINSNFLKIYFDSNKWNKEMYKIAVEGARNHGLLNIPINDFFNTKHLFPSISEQEKIADFLSAIDKKIGFMEKKHTLYQNIKKYYLENLFPKENETIPNLRFLEFNNDWIKTTLGNCVIFLDEKRIPLNQQIRSQMLSKYPYYGAAGIIDYVNNYIFDDELILLGEDGSIIPTLASGKCWVSNHAHVLKNKKNINLYFLYNILSKIHFEKYNTGTIQPKLNKKTAKNIKIKITSKKEQEKIVDFMLSIGTKIKKIQKQIKFLKTFKKGLLQKMFC